MELTDRDEENNQPQNDSSTNETSPSKGTSYTETMMNLIQANIGPGLLAMPLAFKNAGLLVGTFGLWIMALICLHCLHILIESYNLVCASNEETYEQSNKKIGYHDLVYLMVKEKYGQDSIIPKFAKAFICTIMVICQFGFCCAYFVFIPTNIFQVIQHYYPSTILSVEILMSITLGPMILYCMIDNLKTISSFCTIANVLMMGSMLVILYSLFFDGDLKPLRELELAATVFHWPKFFASALFAFEGIGAAIPIFYAMKEKSRFSALNGVLNISIIVVTCMYYVIGFFGYLKYGLDSRSSITLSLPAEHVIYQLVKVFFAIAVFFSYSLQFLVAYDIVWSLIVQNSKYVRSLLINNNLLTAGSDENLEELELRKYPKIKLFLIENFFRACIIIPTFVIAILIPEIDLVINLFGAVTSTALAIIIPILLDLMVLWPKAGYPKIRLIKDIIIILFGIYVFAAGSYASLYDIVKYLKKN